LENKISGILVGGDNQRRLLKYLMTEKHYDPLERPVEDDSQTLPISINLALQQIINFVFEITSIFFFHAILFFVYQ
jgi:hypothetical protein